MAVNQWDAELYRGNHAFVFNHGESVLELLAPQAGERILDVGCGTGELTARIAEHGAHVVGMDYSEQMIVAARQRFSGIEFAVRDAASFAFEAPFDAVFSNAALHWVADAQGAARCMAAALKPGGRLVAELGGHGNIARLMAGLDQASREVTGKPIRHDWYFPTLAEYAGVLEAVGLAPRNMWLFHRPTYLTEDEHGLARWIDMFAGRFLNGLDDAARGAVVQRAEEVLRPSLWNGRQWVADYWRLRLVAVRPD